jgi:7-keto-8-aminopelargonate synthetase-like enzyme
MAETARRSTGEVLDVIHHVLTPYLGKLMASTAAVAHCEKLGIRGTVVEQPQVEQLVEKLRLGLVIFLGRDQAARIADDLKVEISTLKEVTH